MRCWLVYVPCYIFPNHDMIIDHVFSLWISLGAQRWSWTAWIQSLPRSLLLTTISRWSKGWSFACMILTMTPMIWAMMISWGSLNVPWARWASLGTVLKDIHWLFLHLVIVLWHCQCFVSRLFRTGRWLDLCCWRTRDPQVTGPSQWVDPFLKEMISYAFAVSEALSLWS